MIELKKISKSYDQIKALNKVTFSIESGEFFGFLGPNGAGKSTTLNILSTLLKADEGEIIIDGVNIKDDATQIKRKIGFVPQEISLYEELSAIDNLFFWGGLYGISGKDLSDRIDEALKMAGLWDRRKDAIKNYSGGMKRRINIIASILHDPKILLLDEPTVGIDPQSRNLIFELIEGLNQSGFTIVYTTHYMEEVERLCDKIAILDNGEIVASGTLSELKQKGKKGELLQLDVSTLADDLQSKLMQEYDIRIDGTILELKYSNLLNDISSLLVILKENDVSVNNVKTLQPNLESIFLELTGKKLRDN